MISRRWRVDTLTHRAVNSMLLFGKAAAITSHVWVNIMQLANRAWPDVARPIRHGVYDTAAADWRSDESV